MKILKTVVAYVAAFLLVVMLIAGIKVLAQTYEQGFMIGGGVFFAGVGLWFLAWPQAVVYLYQQGQAWEKKWQERFPTFAEALERVSNQAADAAELSKELGKGIYTSTLGVRILGLFELAFGTLILVAVVFGHKGP